MLTMFESGGVFNWIGVAVFVAGLAAWAAQLGIRERTRLPGLHTGLLTLLVATGVLGAAVGSYQALVFLSFTKEPAELLLRVCGIVASPVGFTALWAAVLGVIGPMARARVPASVRQRIHPARALGFTTHLGLVALGLGVAAGGLFAASFLPVASHGGVAPASVLVVSIAASLVAAIAGLAQIGMALVGGVRGWLHD